MPINHQIFSFGTPTNTVSHGHSPDNTYPGAEGENGISQSSLDDNLYNTKSYSSFSGSDIVATIAMPGKSAPVTFATLRTISYSLMRDKRPLRLLGSMNPVTWSKSNRLVAGTLIFTSFDRYVWFQLTGTLTSPRGLLLADMLPPFDITVTALNEYSQTSRLTIRGVRIVDEGAVIGVDDMYVEQSHTFVAQDIIPWIPGNTENA